MLGVIEFDQASPLESENPDPLKLVLRARAIIFFYTRVDTSSASDAPGEIEAISPEGIGKGLLRANLKFLAIFLKVSLLEFGDDPFLFFRRHLLEMFLKKVLGFLFRTGGEKRNGQAGQSSQGSISDELSTGITLVSHFSIPLAGGGRLRLYRFKFRIMGVMAVGAEKIGPLAAGKITRPFPVNAAFQSRRGCHGIHRRADSSP